MSRQLISQYYNKVDKLIQFSGSRNEETIKSEFAYLLNSYAERKNLLLVREVFVRGTKGKDVKPDGTLKNILRLDYGYWESKDEADVIDDEIDKKIKTGYPLSNILFEDSRNAILFQASQEVMRIDMRKPEELDRILTAFTNFEKPEVRKFTEAIEKFKQDIPVIVETLRTKIDAEGLKNKNFLAVSESFLDLCKTEINPDITMADVREMMIQHILTSDIFNKIFDDPEFHRHNNIANELEKLIASLFNHSERKNLLGSLEHYYDAINAAAASVADHHEKQKFLKALYENFYKAYNPKAADRLGVVYTPNEIVDFMIESTNYLLEKHFKRVLWDKNVEILDPATGTGTFICNMIDKCPQQYLAYKYKNELHANDVAILPYYIANLNIEFTFKQKMGYYEEFPNICFVDTLDNTAALAYTGKQHSMFGFSSENSRRITEQNKKKISVVIGNPPYNANQLNENENNKNREYPYIDKRIKDSYIKYSKAQKPKVYDMYARFYRWASDRVDKNGVITLITNNSFINARTFDGFRKSIQEEFDFAYIVDLGGNIRELSGKDGIWLNEDNTIFGVAAAVGIAVMWLVKVDNKKVKNCQINYIHPCDIRATRNEKFELISSMKSFDEIYFEIIHPDKNNNWINLTVNDWDSLIPVQSKLVKLGKQQEAIFNLYTNGLATGRDEWVYDFDKLLLENKYNFFIEEYNNEVNRWLAFKKKTNYIDNKKESNSVLNKFLFERNIIKWSERIKRDKLRKGKIGKVAREDLRVGYYRPFIKKHLNFGYILIDVRGQFQEIFPTSKAENKIIITNNYNNKLWDAIAVNGIIDYNFMYGGANTLPLYRYNEKGDRIENITDWGREQFVTHYKDKKIKKEDIFHYTYAVLHNPAYRKKYELNLKREFPRIPFYNDFWKWAKWGKQLMDLHINYETAKPFPLKENTYEVKAEAKRQKEIFSKAQEPEPMFGKKAKVKVKLKADKEAGIIEIDELTFLSGVPKEAYEYKLGNRSAIEWVLDQYKEKKPSDPTIAEKFNTYRFADYKEKVIELLKKVCTVSLETVRIVKEMEKEKK